MPKELDFVIIRSYTQDDHKALERLHRENWPKPKSGKDSNSDDLTPEPTETVFIAGSGTGEIVGSIYYYPRIVDADLHSLVVKKEYRRQGIAAELIKVAQDQDQRDGFTKIIIGAGNKKLVRYYESLGFSLISNRKKRLAKDIGTTNRPIDNNNL